MGNGWICLNRSLMDHWLWDIKPFSNAQAWIDLLLLANHKDTKKEYAGGTLQEFTKGTIYRSISDLSTRWGWDRKKTRRFLYLLQSDNMVIIKSTTHGTTINIVNYGKYQDKGTTDTPTTAPTTPQQLPQPLPQQLPINNNDNKENNFNKDNNNKSSRFAPPSLDEVREYCLERHNKVNPERFINFYEAKGWMVGKNKMKDWKAAVRTWEQRDETRPQGNQKQSKDYSQRAYSDSEFLAIERKKLGIK